MRVFRSRSRFALNCSKGTASASLGFASVTNVSSTFVLIWSAGMSLSSGKTRSSEGLIRTLPSGPRPMSGSVTAAASPLRFRLKNSKIARRRSVRIAWSPTLTIASTLSLTPYFE